jgi:hypothetical protein
LLDIVECTIYWSVLLVFFKLFNALLDVELEVLAIRVTHSISRRNDLLPIVGCFVSSDTVPPQQMTFWGENAAVIASFVKVICSIDPREPLVHILCLQPQTKMVVTNARKSNLSGSKLKFYVGPKAMMDAAMVVRLTIHRSPLFCRSH